MELKQSPVCIRSWTWILDPQRGPNHRLYRNDGKQSPVLGGGVSSFPEIGVCWGEADVRDTTIP